MKWVNIGNWCGCDWAWLDEKTEKPTYKIKNTTHNGYRDIWTCGMSGFFDGTKYVGWRQ